MKKAGTTLLTFLFLASIGLVACGGGGSGSDAPSEGENATAFQLWAEKEIEYPEWSTPVVFDFLAEENRWGPTSVRMANDQSEIEDTFNKYQYVIENYSSDSNAYFNAVKINMADDAVVIGAYHLAYKLAAEFADLPSGAVVYSYTYDGEVHDEIIDADEGYNLRTRLKTIIFRSMVGAGFESEAKDYYLNEMAAKDDVNPKGHAWLSNATAWSLYQLGMIEEAKAHFEHVLDPGNFEAPYQYQSASAAITTASFYYALGEYENAIEAADVLLSEEIDGKYYLNMESVSHNYTWTSARQLAQTYKALAQNALDGDVVDLANLADGVYTNANTGYMLTPITVELVINDAKIEAVNVSQEGVKEDRPKAAPVVIPERIVAKQNFDVDVCTSATITSESIKLGVLQGLIEATP